MVEEANKLERRVAAHAHGVDGVNAALRAGVHSIEHGALLDEGNLARMVEHVRRQRHGNYQSGGSGCYPGKRCPAL